MNKDKLELFFKEIYKPLLEEDFNSYITIFKNNNKNNITEYYSNIYDLIEGVCKSDIHYYNTYYSLATTNGLGRHSECLKYRTVLGFDFDYKNLKENCNISYIQDRFNKLGLYYDAIVNSGNGFHFYIFIDKTDNIELVSKVNKIIAIKLGADVNATLSTQLLRVPYTFNIKNEDKKRVVLVHLNQQANRKSIDYYAKRFNDLKLLEGDIKDLNINNDRIPYCMNKALLEGATEGYRHDTLYKLVKTFKNLNLSQEDVANIIFKWNTKNNPPIKDKELNYQIPYIYNNNNGVSYDCLMCDKTEKCFTVIYSDFKYGENDTLIKLSESHTKYLKKSTRKGIKNMTGNDILIYSILKNHNDGLFRDEIIKVLSYKDKKIKKVRVALSKNTLSKTLNNLIDNDFISCATIDRKKFYKIKDVNSNEELLYTISISAMYEVIKGNISTEELRLYNYMRYLHNKAKRENIKALKGNLFQCNQVILAKDLGVTQGRISQMIDNLLNEKLLDIWFRQPSENNGFTYNIYRLNY